MEMIECQMAVSSSKKCSKNNVFGRRHAVLAIARYFRSIAKYDLDALNSVSPLAFIARHASPDRNSFSALDGVSGQAPRVCGLLTAEGAN